MTQGAHPSIGIVGSGFGAVACAIELVRAGHTDVRLWERSHDLGGVWRDNTYPGAGCDIPSPLYSFSYEPNPQWSRRYAMQDEIHRYLRRTARKYGVAGRVEYGTEIAAARFDESNSRWLVETADGRTEEVDVLVSAVGQLSRPAWPALPGLETFDGPCFHSARWDHGFDAAGRRVAVVGTGASAVQFVPHLARDAASLTVFQRSAPYVAPKPDRPYRAWHRTMFRRLPLSLRAERAAFWGVTELMARGMTDTGVRRAVLGAATERICRWHLRRQVPDDALRAKLTPDYPTGCKRVLFSNEYLPTLARPEVEVVSEPITEVTRDGLRTSDGRVYPADAVVIGTGFAAQEFLAPMRVTGAGGAELDEVWAGGAHAYLGMSVPGFPNLFLVYGPNTNLGSGSVTDVLEAQASYIRSAVDHLVRVGAARVQVRPAVAESWDEVLQRRLEDSVWSHCTSWYRHESGRVSSNWPGTAGQYARRTRHLDAGDYDWSGDHAWAGDRERSLS